MRSPAYRGATSPAFSGARAVGSRCFFPGQTCASWQIHHTCSHIVTPMIATKVNQQVPSLTRLCHILQAQTSTFETSLARHRFTQRAVWTTGHWWVCCSKAEQTTPSSTSKVTHRSIMHCGQTTRRLSTPCDMQTQRLLRRVAPPRVAQVNTCSIRLNEAQSRDSRRVVNSAQMARMQSGASDTFLQHH